MGTTESPALAVPCRQVAAGAAMIVVFLFVYLPDLGRGFIQDDFRWIVESRVESLSDLVALFWANVGFYRPVVALTFAADHALWGVDPFGYALTNLALAAAVALALFGLARRGGLPTPAALVAVGVWLFNVHAVNMALLWISGRTSLLVSLFSLLAARAFLGGRMAIAGGLSLAAMLSKEEAVVLPALFALFHFLITRRPAQALARTAPLWAALAIYLGLRMGSGAFWPADAPTYYQFAFSPPLVARNVFEYADRACTVAVVVAVAFAAAGGVRWRTLNPDELRVLALAGVWIAASYALTVFLPVRSSLYALLPSLGSALATGLVASAALRLRPARFRAVAATLLVAIIVLIPIYRSRNARWVRLADLSTQVMDTIARDVEGRRPGHVVLIDDPAERFNLTSVFGALFPEAIRLRIGNGWSGEVVAEPLQAERAGELTYRLSNGALVANHPHNPGVD